MLSTRNSSFRGLRSVLAAAALVLVAACSSTPGVNRASTDGIDVDPNQPVRVALLVPLGSGDPSREVLGRSLVNSAQLAQADLQNATIDLAIYPTGGTAEGGAAAANQAIAEGAKIIVGPLFSTATAGAQPVAAGGNVKVISLSNNPEVAGQNVYVLGNTFLNSADQLVSYGMARGLRNFAVVYPEGLEGDTARNAVSAAVRGRGAQLVATEAYSLSVTGIQAAAGPAASNLMANGANAVILTDGPTGGLAFISEALRNNGLAPAQVQFLGLQRWDVSAEALSQPSLQGGVFAAPDPGLMAAFDGRYRNAYGETPQDVAALAYDAIAAVGALIAEARASGGSPFSDARITQASGFAGVGGAFRFATNGLNQRNLAILEVRGGQAIVVQRAARGFDSLAN